MTDNDRIEALATELWRVLERSEWDSVDNAARLAAVTALRELLLARAVTGSAALRAAADANGVDVAFALNLKGVL